LGSVRAFAQLISFAVSSPALAVDSQDIFRDYIVTAWGSADGLSSGTVWAIAQDSVGLNVALRRGLVHIG
jgi:hypothetical protein